MKLIRTRENGLTENYLELHYDHIDDKTQDVIARIDSSLSHIEGTCDDMHISMPAADLLYFESVDRKTFAYSADKCIELRESLRSLIDRLSDTGFIRISKSAAVNVYKIDHLQGDANMRVIIFLKNGEKLIMNRGYKKEFFSELEKIRGKHRL